MPDIGKIFICCGVGIRSPATESVLSGWAQKLYHVKLNCAQPTHLIWIFYWHEDLGVHILRIHVYFHWLSGMAVLEGQPGYRLVVLSRIGLRFAILNSLVQSKAKESGGNYPIILICASKA